MFPKKDKYKKKSDNVSDPEFNEIESSSSPKFEFEDFIFNGKEIEMPNREKNPKDYWTEDTEKAIIEYLYLHEYFYLTRAKEEEDNSIKEDREINQEYFEKMHLLATILANDEDIKKRRDEIFRKQIKVPLNRLIENIIFNFNLFRKDVDVKTTHNDCYNFVYMKFFNFNPIRKKKSFSFYGTIAKHYLLGEKKELDKLIQINLDYESNREEADGSKIMEIGEISEAESSFNLFEYVIEKIEEELEREDISENDIKVGDAIVQIFKNHEIIGVYNKNQVYQLIKERTDLETKDITYSLHRFRIFYRLIKEDFINIEGDED